MAIIDPLDPYYPDPDAPRGREEVKAWEAGRAVISLRADFQWLLSSGYRDEAIEFLTWANEAWADAVWGRK